MLFKRGCIQAQLLLQFLCQLRRAVMRKIIQVSKDAVLHFLGRLIGKRNRQYVFEIMGAKAQCQFEILFSQRTGFARASRRPIDRESFIQIRNELKYTIYEFWFIPHSF